MLIDKLEIPIVDFESGTGWTVKPEGACRGDVCIPLQGAVDDGSIDVEVAAELMAMPLVAEERHGLWALGPASPGSRALVSAKAAALRLPQLDGNLFDLASLRGERVVLYAWAPY